MNIEIEKLQQLITDSDKIFLSAEGEEVLIQILNIQKQVEHALETAKQMLEKKALEINPNFSSIQADKIKVYYRSYGSRYRIDENYLEKLSPKFYKVSKRYDVIAEEVEKFADEKGGLPMGINEVERPKSMSFSLKNKIETETENEK